jgi:hypothetical protein
MPEQSINYFFKDIKDEGGKVYLKRDLWEENEWFLTTRLSQFPLPNWTISMIPQGRTRLKWAALSNPFDIVTSN